VAGKNFFPDQTLLGSRAVSFYNFTDFSRYIQFFLEWW
jgi:hypothetical protein